ncbi:MAG: 2-oxoacid:acceptor oxidoreductase family protein [Holosporaceae bacterium]|jgi:pyruvate ferredoxin oxidoreductase gamma subunit|nr:2-oxoacid:acceptor oxidoreductase family protein [Holosporaceae bacterium]
MFQVRIHGRGGQGVVTAAELLSVAAFLEGKHAQAFPSFGSERMGAPVMAFCRISSREIRLREPVMEPDAVIIQDSTLIESVNVFQGVINNGCVLINSTTDISSTLNIKLVTIKCINATAIAMAHIGRPLPNAVLLGSFAAITNVVDIESVVKAIGMQFPRAMAEKNIAAARDAYTETKSAVAV